MHRYIQLFAFFTFHTAIFSKVLDICIFDQQAQRCPQPAFYGRYRDQNQIYINTDLVAVIDTSTGNKATKLRLPGNYKLVFGEVIVNTDLDFMFSDIRLELDVPGFGKLNAIPTCDNQSHTVTVEGAANSYCRYCDICDLTANAEDKLQQEKVIELQQERFGENCHKLRKGYRYSWARNIAVPGPEEFQKKYSGQVDRFIENALLAGKGKLNVKIRLLNKASNSSNNFQKGTCILSQFC